MRLINTQTLDLEEFQSEDNLKYAILSHRWEDGEVTLQDMESGRAQTKPGFTKIEKCCEQAERDGWRYAWVDTCCIDKKSSAELSEAINSMHRWYRRAGVCYAFLSDVYDTPKSSNFNSSFSKSLWFTRGWTLQELLAPRTIHFYNYSWQLIGAKEDLSTVISMATKIAKPVLGDGRLVFRYPIAERMLWAAHRKTTRVEDRAYSLMGLFDVNMPMLYGEGEKAFVRLQEEIIRHSDDHSIFAWSLPSLGKYPGLLAPSPDAFANSTGIRSYQTRDGQSCTITSKGLSITLDLTPWTADTYVAALRCYKSSSGNGRIQYGGIFLRRLAQNDQYARISLNSHQSIFFFDKSTMSMPRPIQSVTINVRQSVNFTITYNAPLHKGVDVSYNPYIDAFRDCTYGYYISMPGVEHLTERSHRIVEVPIGNEWDPKTRIMAMQEGGFGTTGVIDLSTLDIDLRKIKVGFDFDHNPLFFATERERFNNEVLPTANSANTEDTSQPIAFDTSNCLDEDGWSTAVPPRKLRQKGQKGVWAIRGDRLEGVRVGLVTSSRSQKPQPLCVWVAIVRNKYEIKLLWTLHISGLIPPPISPSGKTQSTVGHVIE